jgi:transcriptional regulator with XRE-family HTH domain
MEYRFGAKLRGVREKRGMTMKQVAEATGISESMVSQIERDKVSPALDTMLRMADALEIDMNYLFADFKKPRRVHLVRAAERNRLSVDGVRYEQLSSTDNVGTEVSLEAYLLSVPPGGKKGSFEYGHRGVELGLVLEGEAELEYGDKRYELGQGDSVSFASDTPHQLRNKGRTTLKAVWVVTPPKMFFKG